MGSNGRTDALTRAVVGSAIGEQVSHEIEIRH
jgi:hypothetical protein